MKVLRIYFKASKTVVNLYRLPEEVRRTQAAKQGKKGVIFNLETWTASNDDTARRRIH
jgi:hypothetical protein